MSSLKLFFTAFIAILIQLGSADDCQPINWKRDVGDIVCRYQATTPALVNYYTCTELARNYGIDIEIFFKLNPNMDKNCDSIEANTDYCVRGFASPLVANDGFCGPSHGNATCLGTDFQCCNSKTWKCGNEEADCAVGVCHSGACRAQGYTTTGKCGPKNQDLKCGGSWGSCCNFNGVCGSGASFCGASVCESGNCTSPIQASPTETALPWQTGTTPDGTCGGSNGYTCDIVFGRCCGKSGVCGSEEDSCGSGCQSRYGKCGDGNTGGGTDPAPAYYPYGCYTEATGQRALSAFSTSNYTDMTPQMCGKFCIDTKKTTLFGVEYGGECWCGSSLNPGAVPASSGCTMACPGDASQFCGGSNRLNVFGISSTPPVVVTASSTAVVSSSTSKTTSISKTTSSASKTTSSVSKTSTVVATPSSTSTGAFTYRGCFTEGNGVRALKDASTTSDTAMSASFCGSFCLAAGYKMFGTEYGRECWCGSTLQASSAAAAESDCSFPCSGDAGQKCGAGNRLSVYQYP